MTTPTDEEWAEALLSALPNFHPSSADIGAEEAAAIHAKRLAALTALIRDVRRETIHRAFDAALGYPDRYLDAIRDLLAADDGPAEARAQMLPLLAEYLREHPAGGSLHIVVDDWNTDDCSVAHCAAFAAKEGDDRARVIADYLRSLTEDERVVFIEGAHRLAAKERP
jgi:hypothetical protein